jgi:hypothetical protein
MTTKHRKQIEVLNDPTRFKLILAGRRGGKTHMVTERLCEKINTCPSNSDVFYVGPTRQHAMELMWDQLETRFHQLKWKNRDYISKGYFEFSRGRKLYITGGEKIRRIRGHRVWHVTLDELAFFTVNIQKIWRAVRPSLSDLKGDAMLTTTPDGKGTSVYDFYLESLSKDDWKYFHWPTLANPFIDPEEIADARRELDEKSFRQEYEAEWESFEGLAYYSFRDTLNVKKQDKYVEEQPLDITLDFNVNPTSLIVCQLVDGKARFYKEYSFKNSSTTETVTAFIKDHEQYKEKMFLRVFGDSAGNNRSSNTGFADYFYLRELLREAGWRFEICVPSANPAIVDRVSHVNAWLLNTAQEARIEIDPSCVDLIRDLSSQEVMGRIPTDKNNLGHKADALGYYIYWLQKYNNRKKSGTVLL